MDFFDCIVVGGGHAGVEAASISSKLNSKTLLITLSFSTISKMYCNPSIGGSAKGVVVREVNALGGIMGVIADKASMQMKNLNSSKGPAVQSLRSQSDKDYYSKLVYETLKTTPNLVLLEDTVIDILIEDNKIVGVKTINNGIILCKSVVLTTGTFLNSKVLVGHTFKLIGPDDIPTSSGISTFLKNNNIELIRLKTGTPPRIDINSIDYSKLDIHFGDSIFDTPYGFSNNLVSPASRACFLVYTNSKTHEIIKNNLGKSAMFSGLVEGVGPRYCPSIEDKIVRFSDKERHQLFVEPETHNGTTMYLQGFSTSMPIDVQEQMVHSLSGFENAKIVKYAYAIEYDAINPINLSLTLEMKSLKGLFCAGQINGTSGYEEAAGQGIVAGINASLYASNKEPFILHRETSYIGVMIDDLVTKGVSDPYRLFSSRAEHRMYIRSDNARERLIEKGYELKTIDKETYDKFKAREILINRVIDFCSKTNVIYIEDSKEKVDKISNVLTHPSFNFNKIDSRFDNLDKDILNQVEIEIKYSGYINKEKREISRIEKQEHIILSSQIDYKNILDLSLEARDKLDKIKPSTIGQALRIPGISLSDITVLLIYLKGNSKKDNDK
jgi:tRNA uridine 5-carboxymethylaminomethyl modification enzyme